MSDLRASLGRLGVLGGLSGRPGDELRPYVRHVAELGYRSLWVGEAVGRDPFALLAAIADDAGDMVLGTNIVNIFGRDAMASKMGAMTLHELTGGRFILGLGVSHEHLVQKLRGHEYAKPLTRMREYLEQYHSLPYRGPVITGADGEATAPPIMLGALRTKMTQLSATATAGSLPWFVPTSRIATTRDVLDDAVPEGAPAPLLIAGLPVILESDPERARAAARDWSAPYPRAINYRNNLAECGYDESDWTPPLSDRLIDDILAWGDADALRGRIVGMLEAGADHVILLPIDASGAGDPLPVLEALAPGA